MPTQVTMSPELLAAILGAVMSLAFAYIPKLKDWFSGQASQAQAAIMAAVLVVITIAVFVANCGTLLVIINLTCTKQGTLDALWYLYLALAANQSTYLLAVRPFNKK